ncbi:MAG: hypothetical protein IJT94_03455 [Oscillibacter sp.]|nr:hypothetical protein [Oscillibacter sp.]
MKNAVLEQSRKFWKALEKADTEGMRAAADPACMFVHIGVTCGLDEEMRFLRIRFSIMNPGFRTKKSLLLS